MEIYLEIKNADEIHQVGNEKKHHKKLKIFLNCQCF